MKKTAAIILAGGKGTRMGSDTPKQFIEIGGFPLIYYSLKAFQESFVDEIVLVCAEDEREYCANDIVEKYGFSKVKTIAGGGKERYNSVYNGLVALRCVSEGEGTKPCDIVFIHDGARPFVNEDIIRRLYDAAEENRAAIAAVPAKDTVKLSDNENFTVETPPRDHVWMIQTPQVFGFYEIYNAYSKLIESERELLQRGVTVTDDAMVMEMFSATKVKLVMGDYRNIKITTPDDLPLAKCYITGGK